jgi:hypothetical protein
MIESSNNVMAGLVPAIHVLNEPIVEIIPLGIRREDQTHFPPSRPVFHVLLALDRCADIGMTFREYEPFQSVSLCKALSHSLPVFPDATGKVTGNAGVQCAVWPIGHDVDPSLFHNATLREVGYDSVDGRDKPGHDDKFGAIGAYV